MKDTFFSCFHTLNNDCFVPQLRLLITTLEHKQKYASA